MQDKRTNISARGILWNLCFYAACVFCVFYLKNKAEIKNFDVILVFLPLIILGLSTECLRLKKFTGAAVLDFIAKVIAFVLAQLMFRHIAVGVYFRTCLVGLLFCLTFSLSASITIYRKSR